MSELISNPQPESAPRSTGPSGHVAYDGPDGLHHPGIVVRYDAVEPTRRTIPTPSRMRDPGSDAEETGSDAQPGTGSADRIRAILDVLGQGLLALSWACLRTAYRYPRWALVIVLSVVILGATALTRPGKPTLTAAIPPEKPAAAPAGSSEPKAPEGGQEGSQAGSDGPREGQPSPGDRDQGREEGRPEARARPRPRHLHSARPPRRPRRSPMSGRRAWRPMIRRRRRSIPRRRRRSPSRRRRLSPTKRLPRWSPRLRRAGRPPPRRRRPLRRNRRRPRPRTRATRIRRSPAPGLRAELASGFPAGRHVALVARRSAGGIGPSGARRGSEVDRRGQSGECASADPAVAPTRQTPPPEPACRRSPRPTPDLRRRRPRRSRAYRHPACRRHPLRRICHHPGPRCRRRSSRPRHSPDCPSPKGSRRRTRPRLPGPSKAMPRRRSGPSPATTSVRPNRRRSSRSSSPRSTPHRRRSSRRPLMRRRPPNFPRSARRPSRRRRSPTGRLPRPKPRPGPRALSLGPKPPGSTPYGSERGNIGEAHKPSFLKEEDLKPGHEGPATGSPDEPSRPGTPARPEVIVTPAGGGRSRLKIGRLSRPRPGLKNGPRRRRPPSPPHRDCRRPRPGRRPVPVGSGHRPPSHPAPRRNRPGMSGRPNGSASRTRAGYLRPSRLIQTRSAEPATAVRSRRSTVGAGPTRVSASIRERPPTRPRRWMTGLSRDRPRRRPASARRSVASVRPGDRGPAPDRRASSLHSTSSSGGRTSGRSPGCTTARAAIIVPCGRPTPENIRISTKFTSMMSSRFRPSRIWTPVMSSDRNAPRLPAGRRARPATSPTGRTCRRRRERSG